MKKCASCTKDLPEAALHCVFCGAKQAPAPAVQPGVAKTAFGYSANDVIDAVKQQQKSAPAAPAFGAPRPHSPSQGNHPGFAPTMPPSQPGPAPGHGAPPPGYVAPTPGYGAQSPQQVAASAATMFVPGGGVQPSGPSGPSRGQPYQPPAPPYQPPAAHPYQPPGQPAQAHGGRPGPSQPPPMVGQLTAVAPPPYLTSRSSRPVEPWNESLRTMMFIWGVLTLAAFATPVSTDPLAFNWDEIIHGAGKMKLPMLITASVGLLSVVIAAIPMAPMPRGILASLLGLVGICVPLAITAFPPWQLLLPLAGVLVLVPSLLVRNEYCESIAPRVLITIGVVCVLLPELVPTHGEIPLVGIFKALIDAPGALKVVYLVRLAGIVIVVLSLLTWMPAPATGGAKIFAWMLILYELVVHVTQLVLDGHLVDQAKAAPYASLMSWAPTTAYLVLVGYGVATVFGKQLE